MKSVRELSLLVEELMEDSCIDTDTSLSTRLTAACHQSLLELDGNDMEEEDEELLENSLVSICKKAKLEEDEYYDFVQELIYLVRNELSE